MGESIAGMTVGATTASSAKTNGALIVGGGVGVGGQVTAETVQTIAGLTVGTTIAMGCGLSGVTTLGASGATTLTADTASSSKTTGTLVVTGGVGVSGQVTADTAKFGSVVIGKESAAAINHALGLGSGPLLNSECTSNSKCGNCLGDCDNDVDCLAGHTCLQREDGDPVAVCTGTPNTMSGPTTGWDTSGDYCIWNGDITSNTASGTFQHHYYTLAGNTCSLASSVGSFSLTSSYITSTSVVLASVSGYTGTLGTNGIPAIVVASIGSGSATLTVCNTGSNALAGVLTFNYAIF